MELVMYWHECKECVFIGEVRLLGRVVVQTEGWNW